jgi:TetR/AcrR family transcriptional regulator
MSRPSRVSPDRILAAAAGEFAARGFAGARVDRIARRARVNKAMLYYHFGSKQALYDALLRRTFAEAAVRIRAIAAADLSPADKIDQVIEGIAAFVKEHEHFPAIMMREIAEGGAHLDAATLAELAAVPRAVAEIVQEGVKRRLFRPVDPIAAYFTMFPPIVFYLAGAPIRNRLSSQHLLNANLLPPELFVRHLQHSLRLALAADRPKARP